MLYPLKLHSTNSSVGGYERQRQDDEEVQACTSMATESASLSGR